MLVQGDYVQALGAQFYDDEGRVVDMRQGAGVIKYIRRMDMSNLHLREWKQ